MRRNQLTPPSASSAAQTTRPTVKTTRPASCAVPSVTSASPHPAKASNSGGVGKCATGERRGQPSWLRRPSSAGGTAGGGRARPPPRPPPPPPGAPGGGAGGGRPPAAPGGGP